MPSINPSEIVIYLLRKNGKTVDDLLNEIIIYKIDRYEFINNGHMN